MVKAVILAGGLGSRISEETELKPKPMIEIGGKPILWHIMKIYSHYGINDFVICAGYKGYFIKEYFANYYLKNSDVTFDLSQNTYHIHSNASEDWRVTVVDTGENDMTGSRIRKIKEYVKNDDFFCLTYGDGVSDIDIAKLIEFHKSHSKIATITSVHMQSKYGILNIEQNKVLSFVEKPSDHGDIINGGFFVLSNKVFDYLNDDEQLIFEQSPLRNLATDGELMSYFHQGFWQPMDTLREKNYLEELWKDNKAKWKVW